MVRDKLSQPEFQHARFAFNIRIQKYDNELNEEKCEKEFKHDLQLIQISAVLQENIQFFIDYIRTYNKKKSVTLVKYLTDESKSHNTHIDDKFICLKILSNCCTTRMP